MPNRSHTSAIVGGKGSVKFQKDMMPTGIKNKRKNKKRIKKQREAQERRERMAQSEQNQENSFHSL